MPSQFQVHFWALYSFRSSLPKASDLELSLFFFFWGVLEIENHQGLTEKCPVLTTVVDLV